MPNSLTYGARGRGGRKGGLLVLLSVSSFSLSLVVSLILVLSRFHILWVFPLIIKAFDNFS